MRSRQSTSGGPQEAEKQSGSDGGRDLTVERTGESGCILMIFTSSCVVAGAQSPLTGESVFLSRRVPRWLSRWVVGREDVERQEKEKKYLRADQAFEDRV